jgi:hypothetical protein
MPSSGRWRSTISAVVIAAGCLAPAPLFAQNSNPSSGPFASLIGWWSGEGRLGFKEGQVETVRCRATYLAGAAANALDQTIRCAAASGAIEVKATVVEDDGKLTGTWSERLHDLSGDITGEITPRGFKVRIASGRLTAGMDIAVRGDRQIVEIQFHDSTLVGLTLMLQKGAASRPPA